MGKKLVKSIFLTFLLLFPGLIQADVSFIGQPGNNLDVNNVIVSIANFVWTIFGAFAIIMFIVAGFNFLTAQGEAGKVAKAREAVIWGVVGVGVALISVSIPFIVKNLLGV